MLVREQIRKLREQAGLSCLRCAVALQWSESRWRKAESGERPLYADDLPRVAQVLGVTVARLCGELNQVLPEIPDHKRARKREATRMRRARQMLAMASPATAGAEVAASDAG